MHLFHTSWIVSHAVFATMYAQTTKLPNPSRRGGLRPQRGGGCCTISLALGSPLWLLCYINQLSFRCGSHVLSDIMSFSMCYAIAELRTWEGAVLGLKSGHESHQTWSNTSSRSRGWKSGESRCFNKDPLIFKGPNMELTKLTKKQQIQNENGEEIGEMEFKYMETSPLF